jgi:hypothetical protein
MNGVLAAQGEYLSDGTLGKEKQKRMYDNNSVLFYFNLFTGKM